MYSFPIGTMRYLYTPASSSLGYDPSCLRCSFDGVRSMFCFVALASGGVASAGSGVRWMSRLSHDPDVSPFLAAGYRAAIMLEIMATCVAMAVILVIGYKMIKTTAEMCAEMARRGGSPFDVAFHDEDDSVYVDVGDDDAATDTGDDTTDTGDDTASDTEGDTTDEEYDAAHTYDDVVSIV